MNEEFSYARRRPLLGLLLPAAILSSCTGDSEPDEPHAAPVEIPLRSPEERAFDARLEEIHRDWMGTAWTFHGTSQTPRQGSIACGYFVTTTLEQAGVELERVRLAQAASETMILALAESGTIRRYSDASLDTFLERLRSQGEGYYLVGLDNHTGFLKVAPDGEIAFIHSGPGRGVVEESPAEAPELALSRYRVTGKLVRTEAADPSHADAAASGSP